MKSPFFKEIAAPVLSLFSICLVCSVLLAFTNKSTKDIIARRQTDAENNSKASLVSEACEFSDALTISANGSEYIYYEALGEDKSVIAYIFTTSSKGYGGELRVMTGVDVNGLVTGVVPVVLNETPGLGMKAGNADFLKQYTGKSQSIGVMKNSAGENDIQAISGATVSSRAVTDAVNTALKVYGVLKEANTNG